MFLWFGITFLFIAFVISHHFFSFISWADACGLLLVFIIILICQVNYIQNQMTLDRKMVTGYVTSLIYHPHYTYTSTDGKHTYDMPAAWIIEQRPRPPIRHVIVHYSIMQGAGKEYCKGECFFAYPKPPYDDYDPEHSYNGADFFTTNSPPVINFITSVQNDSAKAHSIMVSKDKYDRTEIGDTSTSWETYHNSVIASSDVIYKNNNINFPYFVITDYNKAQRIIAPSYTNDDLLSLSKLNARFRELNVAIGIIITKDDLLFEKLKRAWYLGKQNDFILVIHSLDGQTIKDINVLGWHNFSLKEKVIEAVQAKHTANITQILSSINTVFSAERSFKQADFTNYDYLDINIPNSFYYKITIYQIILFLYALFVFRHYKQAPELLDVRATFFLFIFIPGLILSTFFC